jgi:hypothetical protein
MKSAEGGSAEPRLVSTLLGHAHVEMALLCLGSLLRQSTEPLKLQVHDDGSLTAEDLERLASGLARPAVVSRREADERLADVLRSRPASRAFRQANPLGLKLLDAALLAPNPPDALAAELSYCDSDVLFLRPFTGLFSLPEPAGALFMHDPQNAYSVRSWHLLREPRLRLAAQVNSGILAFRTRHFDPDLVEWFLAHPEYRFAPVWVEQTAWALLGQAAGCRLLDPRAVAFPKPGREPAEGTVALHFVSPLRSLLEPIARGLRAPDGKSAPSEAPEPVAVRSFKAARLTPLGLAVTEARRRLGRL